MPERVCEQLRAYAFALVVGVYEDVPERGAEDEVSEYPAEGYELSFVTDGEAHAGAFEHFSYLVERAAASPARETIEVLKLGGADRELAVVEVVFRI